MSGLPDNFKQLTKLKDLLEINYKYVSVQDQIRRNLVARLRSGTTPFPGIIGYELDVLPALIRGILVDTTSCSLGRLARLRPESQNVLQNTYFLLSQLLKAR